MFKIPVSNGELIDKFTILEIKKEKIKDTEKLQKVKTEYDLLKKYVDELHQKYNIIGLVLNLKSINLTLWEIEDSIRVKEKKRLFDDDFISLARNVYRINDKRAKTKNKINKETNSELFEVKSYQEYQ